MNKDQILQNPFCIFEDDCPNYIKDYMGQFLGYPESILPPKAVLICDVWDFFSEEQKSEVIEMSHPFYLAWQEITQNDESHI